MVDDTRLLSMMFSYFFEEVFFFIFGSLMTYRHRRLWSSGREYPFGFCRYGFVYGHLG